jgi:hypothetical protein
METRYFQGRRGWSEQSKEWMHRRAEIMYYLQSRMEQEVGKNEGVNQYTPDNVNELSLEKEQLVREERRMEAPESKDV